MEKRSKNPSGQGKKECNVEGCKRKPVGMDTCYICVLLAHGIVVDNRRITAAEYIRRVKIIHGPDKYGYDRMVYTNSKKQINIYCYKCKYYFPQVANAHMMGNGHSKCGKGAILSQEEWIVKATERHNGKYDYSKVVYIDSYTDVIIICPIHGEFEQTANSHMMIKECNDCGRIRTTESARKDTDHFLKRAREAHPNPARYDYSLVEYIGCDTPVKINCNKCKKIFNQTPDAHYAGKGCSKCVKSQLENKIEDHFLSEDYIDGDSLPFATALNSNQYTDNRVFIQEQSFDSCRGERPLPFDFYIPHLRLLIEADGEQHFTANANWETDTTGLYKRIRHDNIKDQWCIDNGYWLLRIAYADKPNVMEIYTSAVWYIEEDADNIKPHVIATKFYQGLNLQHGDEVRNINGYEFLEW
jgi:hypothetical protein